MTSVWPTMTQLTLAEKIRYLRKSRGMSQLELAARLGLTNNSFISHLERGSKRPSPELLSRIAALFSYDLDHLLALDGAPSARRRAEEPELRPVAGADLHARLKSEVEAFQGRMDSLIAEALPEFLWDKQHRLIIEGRARQVWITAPAVAYHGVDSDLVRVALANLERGATYRYLLTDTRAARVAAGQLLDRYAGLPDHAAQLHIAFAPAETLPLPLEVALYNPEDPRRIQGSLLPPGAGDGWEVALGAEAAMGWAAHVERVWQAVQV